MCVPAMLCDACPASGTVCGACCRLQWHVCSCACCDIMTALCRLLIRAVVSFYCVDLAVPGSCSSALWLVVGYPPLLV
jgi:hypothetical protein